MSKKKKKQIIEKPKTFEPTFCGFRLITKNINNLWRWDSLEDVKL